MSRKSQRAMSRRLVSSALAAILLSAPAAARADAVHVGVRMLMQPADGGAAPAAPPPTLADVAGPARTVTLPELLQLTVRQAPPLQLAEIEIEIAEAEILAALGWNDWVLVANLDASTTARRQSIDGGLAIARTFGSGTTIGVGANSSWSQQDFIFEGGLEGTITEYTDTVTLQVEQPLLEGRGGTLIRAAERRARIGRDAAFLARRRDAILVVEDVVNAYWDLVLAQRDLAIRLSSLELAEERLRRTQAAIRGGGIAATEALAVEQVIAQRQEEILAAELTVLERSVALRRLVGLAIGPGELGLVTAVELGIPSASFQLDALLADAYRTSPELALLETQEDLATIEVEVTENGLLPSLDLSARFGPVGVDDTAIGALRNMATFDDLALIGSLTYVQPLENDAAQGNARVARAERMRIKINVADARNQIAQALAQAVVLAESARRRVEIAGRAIELAEQNIAAEQARFGLGKSTNFDVLQRQEELKEAQLRQSRAIIDWQKAAVTISAISGDLLERYGITLPET